MIVIKTRQPDPKLEEKILAFLEQEHIDAGHRRSRQSSGQKRRRGIRWH